MICSAVIVTLRPLSAILSPILPSHMIPLLSIITCYLPLVDAWYNEGMMACITYVHLAMHTLCGSHACIDRAKKEKQVNVMQRYPMESY